MKLSRSLKNRFTRRRKTGGVGTPPSSTRSRRASAVRASAALKMSSASASESSASESSASSAEHQSRKPVVKTGKKEKLLENLSRMHDSVFNAQISGIIRRAKVAIQKSNTEPSNQKLRNDAEEKERWADEVIEHFHSNRRVRDRENWRREKFINPQEGSVWFPLQEEVKWQLR